MKSSSAKDKGQRLLKKVRDMILDKYPLQAGDVAVTPSGVPGPDLYLSPAALQVFPFSVEGKNQEKLNIWKALDQAQSQNREHTPLLIFSRNRSEIYCGMRFEDFLKVQRRAVL